MAILQANIFSKALMRTVTVNAIVPVDKMDVGGETITCDRPFQTLYLLHGIFGNYTDWITETRIARWAQRKNIAVIMPSGDNHFYLDKENSGELYSQFIGEELVAVTRKLFHLSEQRADTYIAGLSMGGYGAMVNGLRYAGTFGAIGALSSAFIVETARQSNNNVPTLIGKRSYFESVFGDLDQLRGSDMDYKALIEKRLADQSEIPKIYMACGLDDFLLQENRDYDAFLTEKGVPHTYEEGPGAHEWDFWDRHIKAFLDWLPLDAEQAGVSSGNVQ